MIKLDLTKRKDRNKLIKRIFLYVFIYSLVGLILEGLLAINFGIAILFFIITTIGDIFLNTNLISSIFAKRKG